MIELRIESEFEGTMVLEFSCPRVSEVVEVEFNQIHRSDKSQRVATREGFHRFESVTGDECQNSNTPRDW